MKTLFRFALALSLLTLITAPVTAQIIESGVDIWKTEVGTYASFALEPLPAGFFCAGSEPFTGRIEFQGVPLATEPAKLLGQADTILLRLDDARFNRNGVAVTRLQMQAMQFEGMELLSNECGTFKVGVELAGEQPITEMKIIKEQANGGSYVAPIHVNVNITFTPEDHGGDTLTVRRELQLGAAAHAPWSMTPQKGFADVGAFRVDSDHDGTPDLALPGTSRSFFAGSMAGLKRPEGVLRQAPSREGADLAGSLIEGDLERPRLEPTVGNVSGAISTGCHYDDGCGHCTGGIIYAEEPDAL